MSIDSLDVANIGLNGNPLKLGRGASLVHPRPQPALSWNIPLSRTSDGILKFPSRNF